MNKRMKACVSTVLIAGALSCSGVTLTVDRVQQRYPWNGLVDIDYTVTYGADEKFGDCDKTSPGDRLEFTLTDKSNGKVYCPKTFVVPAMLAGGTHRATWDSAADGFTTLSRDAQFDATIVRLPAEYMIIDVSGGVTAETYPVTFTTEVPDDGFNQELYKGDKIVLLKIPAGTFWAGSPTGEWKRDATKEPLRLVTITKPFYLGIFEMTQKQYANIMGTEVACANPGDFYPRDKVSIIDLRGYARSEMEPGSPRETETFMSKLRRKCRMAGPDGVTDECVVGFDLPTEWQWEYACKAGTTTPYNSGVKLMSDGDYAVELAKLGRFVGNVSDGKGGSRTLSTTVGSYEPNAWGLYDMHGNVWEWCRDGAGGNVVAAPPTELTDPIETRYYGCSVNRGGCSGHTADYCRSGCRVCDANNYRSNYGGFRLCCQIDR